MGSGTTQTVIANRALQLVGYKPIGSLQDNDRGARAINRCYYDTEQCVLRENYWSFAIQRASVPASAIKPAFGKANYFPLPPDFVMLAPPDQNPNYTFGAVPVPPLQPNSGLQYSDWQIEQMGNNQGLAIATNSPSPLRFRYISNDIQENSFDPCFTEAFIVRLAIEVCEELTQSNTKLAALAQMYKDKLAKAKQRNSFEEQPVQPPVDSYILVRM
jgi:hypothetical protein